MADERPVAAELARYYDLDVGEEQADLDLYLALARSADGPILELAAGSGRLALPLAAAGGRVIGVDLDAHMLARAERAWAALDDGDRSAGGAFEAVQADLTTLDLGRRFELVILGLNSLLLLPGREAQLAGLRSMARHLASNGRAVLDVWLPSPEDLMLYDGRLSVEWTRPDDERGEMVAKLVSAHYDAALAKARVSTFFDAWPEGAPQLRRVSRVDELSFLAGPELLGLVEAAGLAPAVVAQDYALTPFGTGSERMVLVCALL